MNSKIKFLTLVLSSLFSLFFSEQAVYSTQRESPTGEDWLEHVREDLNPWWNQPAAWGDPIGNYPSYRCDNGEVIDLNNLCDPYNHPRVENYVTDKVIVSHSRQIYTYGAAYQLTGNPEFLSLAKAGVDWLLENGIDRENGGTYHITNNPNIDPLRRNAQQQAYGIQGLTFYYYLTGDKQILREINQLHNHIVDNYYDFDNNRIKMFPDGVDAEPITRIQDPLDQLNSYLLLLASTAPERQQRRYTRDLVSISNILISEFYSPEDNIFWDRIDEPEQQTLAPGNANYGNSIKAMWMIYLTGKLADNQELIEFGETNIPRLLAEAYDQESGTWTNAPYLNEEGERVNDLEKSWWIYAVFNQTAGTLSLEDDSLMDTYLNSTINWWFENMVDRENYGVWNTLTYPELEPIKQKQYPWKNGYHSYEHALVGYITSQGTAGEPVELYFAPKRVLGAQFRPYYFSGDIVDVEVSRMPSLEQDDFPDISRYRQALVTFDNIGLNTAINRRNDLVLNTFDEVQLLDEPITVPEPVTILGTIFVAVVIIKSKNQY